MRAWIFALVAVAVVGCRHHRHRAPEVRWLFDRSNVGAPVASITDSDRSLVLGADGARWTENADHAVLEIATDVREPLVAARKRNGRFELAGESGALYTSREILGSLSKWNPGLPGARSMALGENAIVAVDEHGALVRSTDDGKTFASVDVAKQGRFSSVAMLGRVGIALGVPAFGLQTNDDGASWHSIELPRETQFVASMNGLAVRAAYAWHRLDAEKGTLGVSEHDPLRIPEDVAMHVVDGSRALRLFGGNFNEVKIEIVGAKTVIEHVLWPKCERVDAAMRGDVIVATCDQETESKLLRSDDGGLTFHDVPTNAMGKPSVHQSIAVGDGFVWYASRCVDAKCSPARVLDSAGWHDAGDDGEAYGFANDGKDLYALTDDLVVQRWTDGKPTEIARLPAQKDVVTANIGADHGTVRVAVELAEQSLAWEIAGGVVRAVPLPPKIHTLAFAGKRGLARDDHGLLETTDGKTFHAVAGPRVMSIRACTPDGCATDRGFRFGWSRREEPVARRHERVFARPFDCKPAGDWTEVGRVQLLPNADSVDHGVSQWVVGVREENGTVAALRTGWSGAVDRVRLLGPAPRGPNDRSATTVHVQPAGMIARRLSFEHGEGGVRNPVSVSAAWLRNDGGRFELAPRVVGTFFVTHDPQGPGGWNDNPLESGPWVTWLGMRGLWFHGPQTGLWHFQDDGVVTTYYGATFDVLSGTNSIIESGGPRVFSGGSTVEIASPRSDAVSASPLLGERGECALFQDRPVGLWRGKVIPFDVSDEGAITAGSDLPAIDASTPACAPGPGAGAITVPFAFGERHPVVVGADHRAYATARIRGRIANGSACVVAWEAESPPEAGREYGALVFANEPKRSIEFVRDLSVWPPKLSMRPLACQPADLPFPEELADRQGFTK